MDDLRYQVDMLTAMNRTYAANEKIYKLMLEASNKTFVYFQPSTGTLKSYGNWNEYFKYTLNDYSDLVKALDMLCDEDRENVRKMFFLERENVKQQTYVAKLTDNKTYIEIQSTVIMDENGVPTEKLISFMDVTKKQNLNDELSFMAHYDFVTGLLNRNNFIQKLKGFLDKAEYEKNVVSVIMLDIDDFHRINDGMGIIFGDEVIQNFGLFLRDFCSEEVLASRFDGDIYAIAIYDPQGSRTVESICNAINDKLKEPFVLTNGSEVSFTVSMGVAEYPESGKAALEIVNAAEIVMLKAKDAGKNNIKYFDATVLNEFMNSVTIENKLKLAINNMEFFLNYQPQYSSKSKTLRGVETLIRWKDNEGKFIPPSLFIPMAEKNGSIVVIGDWVLEESIKTFMDWKKKFDMDLVLSVNISPIQYKLPDFVNKVISTINKYGMKPEELELEITESVLIDDIKNVFEKMEELRDFGVKVSIDDFGTGFSSLQYLKGLPADTIKIDKSFIDSVLNDESTGIIVETIVELCKKLGYETIAEGVETEEQLEFLRSIDCDEIQGYLWGKPMPHDLIEEILLRLM